MARKGYHHGNLKQALVEATIKLIEQKGPLGFTLSEAAKQAGVSTAAPYRHFKGREDLTAEVARQGFGIFADLLEFARSKGGGSSLTVFESVGRAYLAFEQKIPRSLYRDVRERRFDQRQSRTGRRRNPCHERPDPVGRGSI